MPSDARSWGLARKLLNIFLRDCLYTVYLRDAYHLDRAEAHLEIPLDSITSAELRANSKRGELPAWRGVRDLTWRTSREYQRVGSRVAKELGIERVHLDAYWWSMDRD